jgi:hypothetical protein
MSPGETSERNARRADQSVISDFGKEKGPRILVTTREDLEKDPRIQVIRRRVSLEKLVSNGGSRYYGRVKHSLKKKIDGEKEVLIDFVPDEEIKEKWVLRTILTLQRELTENVVIPTSSVDIAELEDWISYFRPRLVVQLV